jgi:hypothetical protein
MNEIDAPLLDDPPEPACIGKNGERILAGHRDSLLMPLNASCVLLAGSNKNG